MTGEPKRFGRVEGIQADTLTLFGLVTATLFAGAAFYINRSEQPARLSLDDHSLLHVWRPSYAKGFEM